MLEGGGELVVLGLVGLAPLTMLRLFAYRQIVLLFSYPVTVTRKNGLEGGQTYPFYNKARLANEKFGVIFNPQPRLPTRNTTQHSVCVLWGVGCTREGLT